MSDEPDFSSYPRGGKDRTVFVVLSYVLRVRRDITDFQRVDAVLSTTVRAVSFCRTLSDGRVSTRGFFRPLLASLRRPLLLASCGLS